MTQKKRQKAEETLVRRVRAGRRGRKRYVKYSPLSLVFLAICSFVFSFSILGLFEQPLLDAAGRSEIDRLIEGAFDSPVSGGDDNSIVPSSGNFRKWQQIAPGDIDTTQLPYLQFPRFDSLKEQNEDTVAWMYWPTSTDVKGLPFNLPVVQSVDNEFYLSKSFDKSYSNNGWVYVDYRCNMENIADNRNTIIYAHARSYLMFGGLRYLNSKTKWQQDGYNHFIYLNTPTERTVWQVFAWYETTTAFNYIETSFSGSQDYVSFFNTVQSNNTVSAFKSFTFVPEDRILTLSTCKGSNSDVRIAMHAVLVKHENLRTGEEFIRDPWSDVPPEPDNPQNSDVISSEGSENITTDTDAGADASVTQISDSASTEDIENITTDTGTGTDVGTQDSDVASSSDSETVTTDTGGETDSSDLQESDSVSSGDSENITTDTGAETNTDTNTDTSTDTNTDTDTDAGPDTDTSVSQDTASVSDSVENSESTITDSGENSDVPSPSDVP